MTEDCPHLSLTLPSDLRLLVVARAFVEAVCQTFRFDQACTEAIGIALHEALSNVVRHAHRDHPDAQLQIDCYLHHDRMEILVQDEGEPFNLAAVPKLNPAELRIGGRGVFLMRTLMDELDCQPRGLRGNVLRMVKRRGRELGAALAAKGA
jgi:serine/threonine-protein kinase RsbW